MEVSISTTNEGLGATEWIVLGIGGALAVQMYFLPPWLKFKESFLSWLQTVQAFFLNLFASWQFYLALFLISLPFLFYLNYRLHKYVFRRQAERAEEKRRIVAELEEIKSVLKKEFASLTLEELNKFIQSIHEEIRWIRYKKKYLDYLPRLEEKLEEALKQRVITKRREAIQELKEEKEILEEDIQELERQKRERELEQERVKDEILDDLDIHMNPVFKRQDLSGKEVDALLESGYFRVNEYCPYEQKMITILVKPKMQHSKTHTFLVWSLRKILEDYPNIKSVQEHLTKDADLTFIYEKQLHALEAETGTLLGKKEQLAEKVSYLNRKYPHRWMFIVSHRDLLPKYRKFGLAVTRKDVQKALEKMLNSHTRKKRV